MTVVSAPFLDMKYGVAHTTDMSLTFPQCLHNKFEFLCAVEVWHMSESSDFSIGNTNVKALLQSEIV